MSRESAAFDFDCRLIAGIGNLCGLDFIQADDRTIAQLNLVFSENTACFGDPAGGKFALNSCVGGDSWHIEHSWLGIGPDRLTQYACSGLIHVLLDGVLRGNGLLDQGLEGFIQAF